VEHEISITPAGAERLDDVEPVWRSLHDHHVKLAPDTGSAPALRSPDESWSLRRASYEEWLREPQTVLLIAGEAGEAVGYALVRVARGGGQTWRFPEKVGIVETLALLPRARGRGVGARLMGAIQGYLREQGAGAIQLDVLTSNEEAIRFYERQGLQRLFVTLVGPAG
jgi:ribosomal protein S18 acetylase RimI-like enzyme